MPHTISPEGQKSYSGNSQGPSPHYVPPDSRICTPATILRTVAALAALKPMQTLGQLKSLCGRLSPTSLHVATALARPGVPRDFTRQAACVLRTIYYSHTCCFEATLGRPKSLNPAANQPWTWLHSLATCCYPSESRDFPACHHLPTHTNSTCLSGAGAHLHSHSSTTDLTGQQPDLLKNDPGSAGLCAASVPLSAS